MAAINFSINGNNQGILRSLQQTQNAFKDTARAAEAEGMRIEDVFDRIKQAATMTFAGISAKEFVQKMVQVRGEFQQLEIAFTTMLQSEEKANDLMNQLVRTAAITPFDLKGVAEGAKQLLAYGTAAEEVNETITRLGDIAAGLSIPLGDLVYLYGTTMVQGRMFTQDLRQFQGRGIPIAEEIAKIMGVTKDAVAELVTAGEVTDQVFKKAIENMTSEGSKFGGLMEAQSKTITGQISNIEDALDMMFNDLGKQSEGVINDALSGISYLVEHYEEVGKVILTVAASFGAYKAALFAVMAAQKIASVWGEVQAFFALAKSITSAKDAMLLLNMAVKANPLGLLLSTVTALAASFYLFSSNEGKAAEMASKFGDRAVSTMNRVKTLTTTLNGLTAGTSTHTKVMGELNDILEDYGIEAIKEGDSIDSVNQKREKAIELIKREGIERQRANNLEQGMAEYSQALSDAQKKLYENLTGANTVDLDLGLVGYISGNKELQENASAISTIIANVVEANISKIANKTGEEYQNGLNDIFATIQERMRAIGISEETIASEWLTNDLFNHQNLVQNYVEAIKDAEEAHGRYRDMVNKSADAERDAADGATTYAEKLNAIESSLQGPNDSVHQLYTNIKNLMSQYNENTIGFTIRIGGEVPKWMETMDIPQLQELAKRFSSLGAANPNGLMIGDKYWSRQELLQRGADYATAADQKQTKKEADERAAREAAKEEEKNKKQREQEARRRAQESERLRKEKERYDRLTAEQRIEYERSARDLELSTAQAQIDAMEEGSRKTIAQINLDFERQEEEIKRGYEDLKQKKIDQARQLFEANPANKGKVFNESSVDTTYTEEERKNYMAQLDANAANYRRSMEEVAAAQMQDLYDYLKEYGTIEQQRYAITKEYDAKIAKENSETRKKILEEEKKSALSQVTAQSLAMNIDWNQTFSGLGNVLEGIAKETLANVRAYMKTDEYKGLGAADKQAYQDLVSQLVDAGGVDASSPFKTKTWDDIAKLAEEYKARVQDFLNAQKTHKDAVDRLVEAENELKNATTPTAQAIAQMKVNMAQDWVNETGQQVKSSEREKDEANEKLHTSTESAAKGLDNFSTTLNQLTSGTLSGFATGVYNLVNQISGSGKKAAASLGEIGGKAGGLIGAILQIIDALGEDPAKFIEDLLDKVAKVVEAILRDLPEIIANVVKGVVNIVGGVVSGIGQLFGADLSGIFGGSTHNFDEATKKWGWLLDTWKENLEYEKELMKDAYGDKVTDIQNKTTEQLRQTQQAASQLYRAWASDGGGWFSHSNGYKDNRGANWSYLWQYDPELAKKMGAEQKYLFGNKNMPYISNGSVSNLFNLSADELEKLKYGNRQFWESLSEEARKYLDTIIDAEKEIKQLEQEAREQLTSTSFDSLSSDFQNQLTNMDSEAEDFADNFEKYMKNAVISSLMISKYKPLLEAWYKNFANAMESDSQLTAQEQEALKKEYDNIVNAALAERDSLKEMLDWSGGEEYTQEASSKGFQAMSQDTGEELNGRFTALQIAGESINAKMDLIINAMNTLQSASSGGFDIGRNLNEVRGLIYLINSNVDSINERMKKYYERWDSIFSSIEENTQKL